MNDVNFVPNEGNSGCYRFSCHLRRKGRKTCGSNLTFFKGNIFHVSQITDFCVLTFMPV